MLLWFSAVVAAFGGASGVMAFVDKLARFVIGFVQNLVGEW